jgi:hypothetical protein
MNEMLLISLSFIVGIVVGLTDISGASLITPILSPLRRIALLYQTHIILTHYLFFFDSRPVYATHH